LGTPFKEYCGPEVFLPLVDVPSSLRVEGGRVEPLGVKDLVEFLILDYKKNVKSIKR
jgi:hypothetical protein